MATQASVDDLRWENRVLEHRELADVNPTSCTYSGPARMNRNTYKTDFHILCLLI